LTEAIIEALLSSFELWSLCWRNNFSSFWSFTCPTWNELKMLCLH